MELTLYCLECGLMVTGQESETVEAYERHVLEVHYGQRDLEKRVCVRPHIGRIGNRRTEHRRMSAIPDRDI